MTKIEDKAYITFGAQWGGEDAYDAAGVHLLELRRLLRTYCNKEYAVGIEEFAPIARIDGELDSFNFEGCEKLRFSKKGKYLTIDVGMPRDKWDGVEVIEIKKYLFDNLKKALEQIVARLKKEKIEVQDDTLYADLKVVEEKFIRVPL